MTTSTRRLGWESILSENDSTILDRTIPNQGTERIVSTIEDTQTWCNLIAMLQATGIVGLEMKLAGFGDPVGSGTYFEVSRHRILDNNDQLSYQDQDAQQLPIGSIVALKRVIPRIDEHTGEIDLKDTKQLRAVALEVRALCVPKLREHQNIVDLLGVAWETRGNDPTAWPTLVLEYCDLNLSEYQKSLRKPLSTKEKVKIAKGISAGLSAIHSLCIVHGDIKSENVLIKIQESGEPIPKLADFGCSLLDMQFNYRGARKENVRIGGTNPWRAPECFKNSGWISRQYAQATDLYSYGLLWWRLVHDDKDPFQSIADVSDGVLDSKAKEKIKAKDGFATSVKMNILSLLADNADAVSASDITHRLLQAEPDVRLKSLSEIKQDSSFFEFSIMPTTNNDGDNVSSQSWWTALNDWGFYDPILNVQLLRRGEIRDDSRRLNASTKQRIFQELSEKVDTLNKTTEICPGCSYLSIFDEEPNQRTRELSDEDYLTLIQEETSKHICISGPAEGPFEHMKDLPFKVSFLDFRASIQLFNCYLDGFGVEPDIDKALACLVGAAERGLSLIQADLAAYFSTLDRPWPKNLPLRRWMMNAVVNGAVGDGTAVLARTDPKLLEIAKSTRFYLFDGTKRIDEVTDKITPSEAKAGINALHKAACDWEEPLPFIRSFCNSSRVVRRALNFCSRKTKPYAIDITTNDGETPLLMACRGQRRNTIKLLLSLGANASIVRKSLGDSPLHWVTLMDNCEELIDELLARGADINAQSERCLSGVLWGLGGHRSAVASFACLGSPLYWAVVVGNLEATRSLVQHGADINLTPPGTTPPLELAIRTGRKAIVEALLSKLPSDYSVSPVAFYQLAQDPTRINRCIYQYTDDDVVEIAKMLSKYGPRDNLEEIFHYFRRTIESAIRGAAFRVLEAIFDCVDACSTSCGGIPGKPFSNKHWNRLSLSHFAAKRNDVSILDLTLTKGARIDDETIRAFANWGGSRECLDILLKNGATFDAFDKTTVFSPFALAVLMGNIDTARAFAEHMTSTQLSEALSPGGKLLQRDGVGVTLLGGIIMFNRVSPDITVGLNYLFSLPLEMNAANFVVQLESRRSALHMALDDFNLNDGVFQVYSNLAVVRFLLSKFPEEHHINAKDISGLTPLHVAAWYAKLEECQLLVEAGADVNIMDDANRSAFDCCFLPAPPMMTMRDGNMAPTRETIRRFEVKRNACAAYLRSKGARSWIADISRGNTLSDNAVPFPNRISENRSDT